MITNLFDIALNSIKVAQLGLDITANNVANIETPGYVRRSPVIDQLPHNKGSMVRQIKRESSPFVISSWQNALAPLGYYKVKDQILNQLQEIFNELEGGGIKQAIKEFWDAWEMVANDAADLSIRSNLIQKAKNLVINIHLKKQQLLQIKDSIDSEIENLLQDTNKLTERVAELNSRIKFGRIAQKDVNNLIDERDNILRKLSEDIGIRAIKKRDAQIDVLIQGQGIVMENQNFMLKSKISSDGSIRIIWNDEVDITSRILASAKGKLSAYLDMRNSIIPKYINALDNFAQNIAELINTQHRKGYDLNGNKGTGFFRIDPDNPAGSIELNINDPEMVAAASSPDTVPSDNRNALSILEIKDKPIPSLGDFSIDGFYNNLISEIGNKAYLNKKDMELQKKIVKNAEDYFDSISGVNLDEEAVNTLKFQYMYTASAKLISVASEITEIIINMV